MEWVHPESQSMYLIEVSKMFWPSWLFIPETSVIGLGRSRYRYLTRSDGFQANFEVIYVIIYQVCVSLYKMTGGFLSLILA